MSDVVLKSVSDNSIGAMWGRLIFFSVVASSAIHALVAAMSCWSLILSRPRMVLAVVLIHFAMGVAYSFISCCIMSLVIALTLYTINNSELGNTEMTFYVCMMSAMVIFFSWGRATLLYAF